MNRQHPRPRRRKLLDALRDAGVFAAPGFLDEGDCRRIRLGMDRGLVEAAEVLDRGMEQHVRRASNVDVDRELIDMVERRLDAIRADLAAFFGVPLGDREGAGFLRYPAGGFYKPHRDRGESADWPDAARRQVSVVIFLNSSTRVDAGGDFGGGALELCVDTEPLDVNPERGLLLAFRADVLHQVTRVSDGTRDTIVDWYYAAG